MYEWHPTNNSLQNQCNPNQIPMELSNKIAKKQIPKIYMKP